MSAGHALISHLHTERLDTTDTNDCPLHRHKLTCNWTHDQSTAITLR